jgi:hypothetical protein
VENGVASNRLDVYDRALGQAPGSSGLPPRITSLAGYGRFLEERSLFGDSKSCFTYLRPMPERGVAVEVRCLDKQPTLAESVAFAALAKAIMTCDGDFETAADGSADRLEGARRHGVVDPERTGAVLEYFRGALPDQEQHHIDRLLARMEHRATWRRLLAEQRRLGPTGVRRLLAERLMAEVRGPSPVVGSILVGHRGAQAEGETPPVDPALPAPHAGAGTRG